MSLSSSAPWLKYYGNVPQHLSYPQKTIYQMVKAAAERNPKLPAYEFMGKKTTFTQFMQKIDETAQAFLAMGIKKGDRVTICMPNCPQALHAFYGLNRIGAVSNMIHPLSAAGEIRFYLNFSHSKCILTLDQFYAKIAPIMPELDDPDCKLLLAKIEDELYPHLALGYALTAARKYPKPPKKGNYIWWSEFQRVGKKRDLPLPRVFGKADEGASILYSGGTTGTTKGILLSNMNFNALGLQTIAASGFSPIDGLKMLSVMPVFHGFGLGIGIHTALIGGACCILVPKFNVNTYAELLIKKQPNIIPGVPTLFEALLRAEKLENADLSCLKGVFCGGDSNDPEAVQQAVLDEARRVVREGVDPAYVQRIRRASFGASIKSLNSFEAIASTAAEGCFQGYDPFRFPEVYDSITQQDLLDFIRDNIRPERMALSIIYPKE